MDRRKARSGPAIQADETVGAPKARRLLQWKRCGVGFLAGIIIVFVAETLLSQSLCGISSVLNQNGGGVSKTWHLDDMVRIEDVNTSQCTVAPSPTQIVYNRIGKAGSMSVSQAIIHASHFNGFEWKQLPTGEFGTPQQFLEVVQQYVGAGLGCVRPTSTSRSRLRKAKAAGDSILVESMAKAAKALPPCDHRTLFIGHVFYFDLADYLGDRSTVSYSRPAYVRTYVRTCI